MTCLPRPDEKGSISVEVAMLAPAFVFLMLLVVYAGKVSEAEAVVERAASNAARAASLRQHPGDAERDARDIATANMAAAGLTCVEMTTSVDTSSLRPGGTVGVTVRCEASMSDVALLGVPGRRTFTATAVEVIDRYRSDP